MQGQLKQSKSQRAFMSWEIPLAPYPFKMEVKVDIHIYNRELDLQKLDDGLKQLEIYFSTKQYTRP